MGSGSKPGTRWRRYRQWRRGGGGEDRGTREHPGTSPDPPSPMSLILVCPPETSPSPVSRGSFVWRRSQAPPSLLAVDLRGVGGPCFWCSQLPLAVKEGRSCALLLALASQPPPSPGSSQRLMLPPPFLQCHRGGGRDLARPPGTHPAVLRPLSRAGSSAASNPACTALVTHSPRSPDPALPLSSRGSRGRQHWLVRCSRSLGTAGAGSSKFSLPG